MALRYQVKRLFAHDGRTYTNQPQDLEAIKKLSREVRDHHIDRGNLVEWSDSEPAAPAPAATKKSKE